MAGVSVALFVPPTTGEASELRTVAQFRWHHLRVFPSPVRGDCSQGVAATSAHCRKIFCYNIGTSLRHLFLYILLLASDETFSPGPLLASDETFSPENLYLFTRRFLQVLLLASDETFSPDPLFASDETFPSDPSSPHRRNVFSRQFFYPFLQVPLLASDETRDSFILVTPYTAAGDLWDKIRYGDTLTEVEARNCVHQVLHGLVCLHDTSKLVHADIKPHNLLLFEREGKFVVGSEDESFDF